MNAAKKIKDPIFHLSLPKKIDDTTLNNFFSQKPADHIREVHLDFSLTEVVERTFYQSLYRLKRELSTDNIELKSFNISKSVQSQFHESGTESFLNIVKKNNSRLVDVHFIQPFINATVNVLQVQAKLECKMQTPTLKSNFKIPYDVDIAGVLSLVSDAFMGSIALSFPKDSFLKICSIVYGMEFTSIDEQTEDAAAEFLNMIFGGAKAELNKDRNYNIQKALPTVIRAESLNLRQYSAESTLTLPFQTSAGPFHIDIEIVKKT